MTLGQRHLLKTGVKKQVGIATGVVQEAAVRG